MKQTGRLLITAAIPLCAGLQQMYAAEKPNVILIMTDDQGYGEMSCHGNPVLKTPNLDKLHDESIRFVDFHVAPMSSPTRGQLITGVDAVRNGTVNVSSGRTLLNKELPTMADFFAENGYNTGIFGKWHLGDNYPFRPQDRGFMESLWYPSSHIGAVPDYWDNDYFDDTYIHNGARQKYEGYSADIFFRNALDYIAVSQKAGKPFFIYIPTNTPHHPLNAVEADVKAMEAAFEKSEVAKNDPKLRKDLIKYMAMIRNIDTNIGSLRAFLKKQKLDRNTIIIFLTDNGSTYGYTYFDAGMRGSKTQLWEGGHRVPLFISYPDGSFTKPRDVKGLAEAQDILPTLIDLCGLQTKRKKDFDGISVVPQLRKAIDAPEDRMLVINYSHMPLGFDYPSPYGLSVVKKDNAAVLWKRWRLLENRQLYDLAADPMQENNVIDKYPDVAAAMSKHLDNWWNSNKEIANQPQRIIIGNDKDNPTMLTACEWFDVFVDQQAQVKSAVPKNGFWLLEADTDGTYEFELRRWPKEVKQSIAGDGSSGRIVPVAKARIYIDPVRHQEYYERFSFEGLTKELKPDDQSAVFIINLKKGPIALHTWFDLKDSEASFGAYYVFVKRL